MPCLKEELMHSFMNVRNAGFKLFVNVRKVRTAVRSAANLAMDGGRKFTDRHALQELFR